MKYLYRLIVLPFVACIVGFTAIKGWVMFCADFLRYGGELVKHSKGHKPTTISDMINYLKETLPVTTELDNSKNNH